MNDEHRSYIDQSDAHISQLEAHVRTVETELAAAIKRAEQAEADRDAARKLCEDDMTWMHDERCSACGHRLRFSAEAIATALRKRDELYDAAWGECERWRKEAGYQRWITGNGEWAYMHPNKNDVYLIHEADAHDTLRRDAGKEKA